MERGAASLSAEYRPKDEVAAEDLLVYFDSLAQKPTMGRVSALLQMLEEQRKVRRDRRMVFGNIFVFALIGAGVIVFARISETYRGLLFVGIGLLAFSGLLCLLAFRDREGLVRAKAELPWLDGQVLRRIEAMCSSDEFIGKELSHEDRGRLRSLLRRVGGDFVSVKSLVNSQ